MKCREEYSSLLFFNLRRFNSNSIFPQVNNNGLLSFQIPVFQYTPTPFPLNVTGMIAPYWADVDTRLPYFDMLLPGNRTLNETGRVWYREEFTENQLNRAESEIRGAFLDHSTFSPTWLFIVTWDAVGYYPYRLDKVYVQS